MRRNNMQLILLILVIVLGIGYAYINSDLNINGTARVDHANWDIHWANIQVESGSVSGTNVVTTPTISNQTTVNYSIILSQPGDYYEFTVDAVNAGAIDAMIDSIDSKLNGATITTLPDYLNYTVTYSDGVALEPNHELLANTTETYKVKVEYSTDINLNQIPATNQTLSLQFTVTYRQANANSIEVPHFVYTSNLYMEEGMVQIGQAMPNTIIQYTSAADALAALKLATGDDSIHFYLKHRISGGIVTESYVEFIISPGLAQANPGMTAGTYTLRGLDTSDSNSSATHYCKVEYYDTSTSLCIHPYYESNKAIQLTAFGSSNCDVEQVDVKSKSFYCHILNPNRQADSSSDGYASAYNDTWYCDITSQGTSYCGEY